MRPWLRPACGDLLFFRGTSANAGRFFCSSSFLFHFNWGPAFFASSLQSPQRGRRCPRDTPFPKGNVILPQASKQSAPQRPLPLTYPTVGSFFSRVPVCANRSTCLTGPPLAYSLDPFFFLFDCGVGIQDLVIIISCGFPCPPRLPLLAILRSRIRKKRSGICESYS